MDTVSDMLTSLKNGQGQNWEGDPMTNYKDDELVNIREDINK